MQLIRIPLVVCVFVAFVATGRVSAQQNLTFSLFASYLESFREQALIPALSVSIVQNGFTVWERGFGRPDLDNPAPARPDTPYLIGELSQTLGSTLLLRRCVDQSYLRLTDRVVRWDDTFPEPATTVASLLSHVSPAQGFAFNPTRFAMLTPVIEECAAGQYARLLEEEILERFYMISSVPGPGLLSSPGARQQFTPETLARFEDAVRRAAVPYRIDRGKAVRGEMSAREADAATGVLSSASDMARFVGALDTADVLLSQLTLDEAWKPAMVGGARMPTGLGWFVQSHTSPGGPPEPLVWQFGMIKDSYSGMVMKLPRRGLSVVMLANSDGLAAPFALEKGDVTKSLFAQLFLRIFAV